MFKQQVDRLMKEDKEDKEQQWVELRMKNIDTQKLQIQQINHKAMQSKFRQNAEKLECQIVHNRVEGQYSTIDPKKQFRTSSDRIRLSQEERSSRRAVRKA